jgi:proteasome accessory factor A
MPLFGVETEYGLAAPGADADPQRNVSAAQDLVTDLRRSVPALDAASGSGIFLGNGMRVYVDLAHLEVATPEVTDPVDAVRFTLAGDRVLERAVARCCPDRARAPMLFKANVSCLLNRASWGCHENILYHADTPDPREALIPHLVSRICYAGSGGLDPSSPGLAFAVSPRALFLEQARSAETMKRRGIVDTKEEPLRAPQYRRLHLIAGEPLSGEIGSYLKIATTVVVVAMIEAGVAPRDAVALADPVAALHAIARDPSCRTEVQLAQGGQATATTIQRSFLEAAEAHMGASFMPSWAPAVCRNGEGSSTSWTATWRRLAPCSTGRSSARSSAGSWPGIGSTGRR